jgi:Xaa-Pro aminopeptidase
VVGLVHDYLSRQTAREGVLVDASGNPVTIGQVKGLINRWLAERGAENPEGTIFSQGRDAAIPHSTGKNEEALRLGVPIVFDIYPCEAGGGYFYDFTRTWCLGYAPDAVTSVYEDVRRVYETLLGEYEVAKPCAAYQARACDLFAGLGHPTIQQNPETEEGFVHSLGHGLGLNIHEQPWFSASMGAQDLIHPGSVFTLEPGLYYPDREIGVRLEDTIWITPQGLPQVLAEYPMDLVIPVK